MFAVYGIIIPRIMLVTPIIARSLVSLKLSDGNMIDSLIRIDSLIPLNLDSSLESRDSFSSRFPSPGTFRDLRPLITRLTACAKNCARASRIDSRAEITRDAAGNGGGAGGRSYE